MRALKEVINEIKEEEYTEADIMLINICVTFGIIFVALAELSRVFM